MRVSFKRSTKNSAGFVITLEFLLVVALVIIPISIGLFLLGKKMVTLYLNYVAAVEQPLSRPVIWDSTPAAPPATNPKVVGPVIGYDQFGAPLVLYRDAVPIPGSPDFKPGILLGVRPNRFTTVSNVYYPTPDCSGDAAFIKSPSAPSVLTSPWPEVGFNAALQGINYAVGRDNNLYRATGAGVTLGSGVVGSVWTSQDTGDSSPSGVPSTACQTLTFAPAVAPFGNLQVIASLASNTDGIATAVTAANHNLRTGDLVTITGAVAFCPSACVPSFDGLKSVTVTSPHSFTYDTGTPNLAFVTNTLTYTATGPGFPSAVTITPGISFTLTSIPDLVSVAAPVARLTGAGNFVAPFRLLFPTTVPNTTTFAPPGG